MSAATQSAAMTDRPVAIVTAMPMELRGLLRRTRIDGRRRIGDLQVQSGKLGRRPVLLVSTGDGRARATRGLEALLDSTDVLGVVVIGVSGGLSPTLVPGSIVVARSVQDGTQAAPPPDPDWVNAALRDPGCEAGTVLTSDTILCTAADKQAAWQQLDQAGQGTAALVDLESAAYARVAASRGVPYLVVRTVSDTADEDLPLDLNRCRDASGSVVPARVVGKTLWRPTMMRELWQLRQRVVRGSENLAEFVERLLDGGRS